MAKYRAKRNNNTIYAIIAILLIAVLLCAVLTDGFKNWNKYCLFGHDYENGVCTHCQTERPSEEQEETPKTVAYKTTRLNDETLGAKASGVFDKQENAEKAYTPVTFINNYSTNGTFVFNAIELYEWTVTFGNYTNTFTGYYEGGMPDPNADFAQRGLTIRVSDLINSGKIQYGTTYTISYTYQEYEWLDMGGMAQSGYFPTGETFSGTCGTFSIAPPTYTYTVKYNANGGSGSMSNQTMTSGQNANLAGNTFTREHYKFKGWATSANGGVVYQNGQSVTNLASSQGATVNLYAVWERSEVVLTFYNGEDIYTTRVIPINTPAQLPTPPTKLGYEFKGWYCDYPAMGTLYNGGNIPVDTYFDAWFEPIKYTIKFHGNGAMSDGAAATMDDQQMTYGESAELSLNEFLKENASFLGWATTPDGEVVYQNGHVVTNLTAEPNGVINLYAVWEQAAYTVTLEVDGEKTVLTVAINAAVIFPFEPTKAGYDFIGWFLPDGTKYNDQPITRDTTLTARFAIKKFTVTFLVDGEEYSVQTVEMNTAATLPTDPIKYGLDFVGWFYVLQDDTQYIDQAITENVTLIAVFVTTQQTVTFIVDDEVYATIKVDTNTVAIFPERPEKDGFTFAGWYMPNGEKYDDQLVGNDLTLTAKFDLRQCVVSFLVNGIAFKRVECDYGANLNEIIQKEINPKFYKVKNNYDEDFAVTDDISVEMENTGIGKYITDEQTLTYVKYGIYALAGILVVSVIGTLAGKGRKRV